MKICYCFLICQREWCF